jgi:hypothetical protein
MFVCVRVGLYLTSRECTGPRVAVLRVLDADHAPEAIVPAVLVTRTDAFNVCDPRSNGGFCDKQLSETYIRASAVFVVAFGTYDRIGVLSPAPRWGLMT